MAEIFYIGGSPCSGKSTVAEKLAKKYNYYYFKADEYLEDNIAKGKAKGKPVCTNISRMSAEETWMRKPDIQNEEELQYYRETFEFVMADLRKINNGKRIIAEGAAFLPELMKAYGVDERHYVAIIPTKMFQVSRYKTRSWVPYVLEGCSDKEVAFDNWMERDALFAKSVKEQCEAANYKLLITDGTGTPDSTLLNVTKIFGLLPKEEKQQ